MKRERKRRAYKLLFETLLAMFSYRLVLKGKTRNFTADKTRSSLLELFLKKKAKLVLSLND